MIIDANNLILGRLASYAAKQTMLGETVNIVNCEKAIVTGSKKTVLSNFLQKRVRGTPTTGPFIHRSPSMIVKRAVRGMLPYKDERGRDAFRKLRCYVGIPDALKADKTVSVEEANISKVPNLKYTNLKTISQRLGAKIE